MAETYKRLAAIAPTGSDEKILLATGAGESAIVSNITVTNRNVGAVTLSISAYDSVVTEQDIAPEYQAVHYGLDGNAKSFAYSGDGGVTFTSSTVASAMTSVGPKVAYGNGRFVIFPNYSESFTATSPAGPWTASTGMSGIGLGNGGYINGKFCFFQDNSNILWRSEDGVSWTQTTLGSIAPLDFNREASAASSDGQIMIFGSVDYSTQIGVYLRTTDGISWSDNVFPGYYGINIVQYVNNMFYAQDPTGTIYSSADANTWTVVGTNPFSAGSNFYLGHNGSTYVAVKAFASSIYVYYSSNLTSWTAVQLFSSPSFSLLSSDGQVFLLYSQSTGNLYRSTDGINWNIITKPISFTELTGQLSSVLYSSPNSKALYKDVAVPGYSTVILEDGVLLDENNTLLVKAGNGVSISATGAINTEVGKYKILGQLSPAVDSMYALEQLMPINAEETFLTRGIVVCNTSSSDDVFAIKIVPDSSAESDADYIFYETTIPGNSTLSIRSNYSLAMSNELSTGEVLVGSLYGAVTFTLFGMEL